VLPPDMVAAANARAPVTPPEPAPFAEGSGAPAVTIAPAPAQPPGPQAYPQPQTPQVADRCGGTASLADQMVCQDPRLAAADRDMARALRRALASGVSPGQLRAEQRDFAMIREDAARRSPRALFSAYAQRIDELNAIAEDGGEGPGA
jgi:hypothetical protein